ncbi:adenine deaminase [Bacillus sp. DTU_2020_1000418_1_SI_GHA_SEK_038]|uniref:adenine deaminase n=1 Tax=Bacillus sp. DTU_2020_1000418_1_SI_GHA_SEK_038 TaxID=3077585 RepID=UPI0028E5EF18|nr:adenine deaminase [Bacillus sp. DTU_2020_1000418_1_SI_GHA_SEK_038]WNS77388.1 adenine deaminase [Bacillus sp. DTU_2020_1000418_1_SI_GHA_SEK_038]
MELTKEWMKRRIDVAAGRKPADLVIKNGKIVNVFTREIIEDHIAIVDGYIAGIGEFEGHETIDASGKYLVPGFIDGHVHIESSMVTPAEFCNVVLPHGVTTIIADPHEIANVSGTAGIDFMLQASEGIPLDVLLMLPSCVPATPFENAGATLNDEDLDPYYEHPRVIGLGEVMDYPSVFQNSDQMLNKLENASLKGKCIDGHAAGLDANGINVYMAAGIRTDHECVTAEEALERLRKGMYVMLREGSAAKDLVELLQAVNENNSRRCLFVTDDKHLDELIEEGSIDFNIKVAIREGIDPVLAIQMATLNAAECFGLKTKGAIAPGYEADILVLNNLENIEIEQVFKGGKLVAKNGKVTDPIKSMAAPPSAIINSINMNLIKSEDLKISLEKGRQANIIEILPNMIVTKHIIEEVVIENGLFQANIEKDQLKLAVLERHNNTGNIGLGIIKGLGINNGAIASTVAHDSHNIVASGTNDHDLVKAINLTREMAGGLVVVQNGNILASLPLPIAGLMSNMDFQTVNESIHELNKALLTIGCSMAFNPFVTLSFLALPVIPELKLTDIGLFDVKTFKHIEVEVSSAH